MLRVIGAIYLLYLAYGAFMKAIQPPNLERVESIHQKKSKHFLAGYLLQVTNPKAISFWIAIASVGAVDGATVPIVAMFIIGAFFYLIWLSWKLGFGLVTRWSTPWLLRNTALD